jgi:hypothetical protein
MRVWSRRVGGTELAYYHRRRGSPTPASGAVIVPCYVKCSNVLAYVKCARRRAGVPAQRPGDSARESSRGWRAEVGYRDQACSLNPVPTVNRDPPSKQLWQPRDV